ncbi:diaminopimelate epimerase [Blattabacterium cuenoti]|uniref:diaminopimelate epimerase n=1 Tax=Blattabacterium cuenoti TaxID=1653831 RepID=UPI00163C5416|nr:diaminopimelate epimerase [Blattabacterium cuenoti]
MNLVFFKLHGTGNDFIILNSITNELQLFDQNEMFFKKLCDRHFGIGADGIILIQKDVKSDFYMKYYNSDGIESTMCGNGARCSIFFYKQSQKCEKHTIFFRSSDGYHYGNIKTDNENIVSIKLIDLNQKNIIIQPKYVFLNTGSPHYITFLENINNINVYDKGRSIRYQYPFSKKGVNVNFVKILDKNYIQVRTYERGIENETLSCGTGVVASVIAAYETNRISHHCTTFFVQTLGGMLEVSFEKKKNEYQNIYLTGPVQMVYQGVFFV